MEYNEAMADQWEEDRIALREDATEDRREVLIGKLCELMQTVAIQEFSFPQVACDCICPGRHIEGWGFQQDPRILVFIQSAVREKLARLSTARRPHDIPTI